MLEGAVMVKDAEEPPPEAVTLPVPDQPVQTYCVPLEPGVGEVTDSVMLVPELNQLLDGVGEPFGDVTVK
jgi:hypothetical protein